jgi:hypothetical protein
MLGTPGTPPWRPTMSGEKPGIETLLPERMLVVEVDVDVDAVEVLVGA